MSTEAQIKANRENAQKSSGPVTSEGKAVSSQNNFRHGFRGMFSVRADESASGFESLLTGLVSEHQPATLTEEMLVHKIAEHYWLTQRARRFQNAALESSIEQGQMAKDMNLWIRYETTNERAFYKALNELRRLKSERKKAEIGFERQKQEQAEQPLKMEAEQAKTRLANAKAEALELETAVKATMQAPLPGNTTLDFNDLKPYLEHAVREYAAQAA